MRHRIARRLLGAAVISSAILGVLAGIPVPGQILHSSEPLPSFEVATIKPSHAQGMPIDAVPMNIVHRDLPVRMIIASSFNLPLGADDRVLGGPDWIKTNYVIDGKVPDALFTEMQGMTREQRRNETCLMLQALLTDRFRLKVHFERREMPVYQLVVAKGGPQLTPATKPPLAPTTPPPFSGQVSPPRPEDMRQGVWVVHKNRNTSEMIVKGEPLDVFLSTPLLGLGRPVINKTGLTGKYDFTLNWTLDQSVTPEPDELPAVGQTDRPSMFTAMQEQLGLKLVPTKGPVEVIIIDHIEMPSEN